MNIKNNIVMFDTSILSENLGDFIIMDAVTRQMSMAIHDKQMITMATHDYLSKRGRRQVKDAGYCLVGGTNLLNSNLLSRKQWKLRWSDLAFLNKAILVGVGWVDYENKPDRLSSMAWRRILHSDYIHSVRDEYTEDMLRSAGVTNVLNTACATMWGLTKDHCDAVPKLKSNTVVFTLTDYRMNREADKELISILLDNYENVYFWPQGARDLHYFQSLDVNFPSISVLPPSLYYFDEILDQQKNGVDYVGTRLHAGIRALQKKRRTIILGVDNRANEKAKSYNLTVIDRCNFDQLKEAITSPLEVKINLPLENISKFKNQFKV